MLRPLARREDRVRLVCVLDPDVVATLEFDAVRGEDGLLTSTELGEGEIERITLTKDSADALAMLHPTGGWIPAEMAELVGRDATVVTMRPGNIYERDAIRAASKKTDDDEPGVAWRRGMAETVKTLVVKCENGPDEDTPEALVEWLPDSYIYGLWRVGMALTLGSAIRWEVASSDGSKSAGGA